MPVYRYAWNCKIYVFQVPLPIDQAKKKGGKKLRNIIIRSRIFNCYRKKDLSEKIENRNHSISL